MDLIRVGIDEEVGKQLETGGVDTFAASYLEVLDIIEARRAEAGVIKDRTQPRQGWVMDMAFQGATFDVDGVLVDSPHELAWRESLCLLEGEWRAVRDQTSWTPEHFTSAVYQRLMAGKPRLAGACAAFEYFGVPDVEARAERYAAAKQEQVVRLIEEGRFMAFPDALRFILAVKAAGIRVAAASSSKNAKLFLTRIRSTPSGLRAAAGLRLHRPPHDPGGPVRHRRLGPGLPRGKPDPAIFLTAAQELGCRPADALVVEDAGSGAGGQGRVAWRRSGRLAWATGTCC